MNTIAKLKKQYLQTLCRELEWTQVNGELRIKVRDKARERRKKSKVKEREGEESMVC